VRPHMLARMPRFGEAQVEKLPLLLESVDRPAPTAESDSRRDPTTNSRPEPSGNLEAGRRLLDVGCIQCHPLRGEQLPGVRGIDLGTVPGRLRRDWFFAFVKDPATWKPGTRMPTFFPNGVSNSPDIADGDAVRQLASLWDYLHAAADTPLPDRLKSERLHNFELVPTDKPLVLRTFMEEVGTHAIAVGFPGGFSFAYDAWNLRPAIAWRGRFLDAHPIWFDRFTPPTPPLGERVVTWAPPPSFARLDSRKTPWPEPTPPASPQAWRGYHLDQDGIPIFRYRWEPFLVQERLAPLADGTGLQRRIEIELTESAERDGAIGNPPSIWFRVHVGTELRQVEGQGNDVGMEVTDAGGWRITLRAPSRNDERSLPRSVRSGNDGATSLIRNQDAEGTSQEWILRITNGETTPGDGQQPSEANPNSGGRRRSHIELEYRW
jgi:mono/diheme cytochrome c family protein